MTRAEVAALFRVTTRTVDAMVADGRSRHTPSVRASSASAAVTSRPP